jgi:hypothetical protein
MRPLNGVQLGFRESDLFRIKHHSLIFDKFFVVQNGMASWLNRVGDVHGEYNLEKEYHYLIEKNVLRDFDERDIYHGLYRLEDEFEVPDAIAQVPRDMRVRNISAYIARQFGVDVVPICRGQLADKLPEDQVTKIESNVLRIAFSHMPVPGDDAAWQDIFDFRAEEGDKQWAFRRFLLTLSTKKQTESEIRDDFEWTMNEYQKFMNIHKLKADHGFIETYVIPTVELVENVAKLNWSKVAKDLLGVRKRKVELLEAEMKAPGRECAYVFDARKRFGKH